MIGEFGYVIDSDSRPGKPCAVRVCRFDTGSASPQPGEDRIDLDDDRPPRSDQFANPSCEAFGVATDADVPVQQQRVPPSALTRKAIEQASANGYSAQRARHGHCLLAVVDAQCCDAIAQQAMNQPSRPAPEIHCGPETFACHPAVELGI